ncbi:MAG: endonuclease/exonuclease/phosphatase family protein, partial [Xanthomonadales bacterium]|nr:endonuclease/exonuclease/phosphatase family protein [Xanthomonadales bacterium]
PARTGGAAAGDSSVLLSARPGPVRQIAGRAGRSLLLGTAICLLIGEAGRWHWAADLFAHFRWQAVAALTLATLLTALAGRWRWAAAGVALVLLSAGTAGGPWLRGTAERTPAARLTVVSFNAHLHNRNAESLLQWLAEVDPDIVVIVELGPEMASGLASLQQHYPTLHTEAREDPWGVGLWSRLPDGEIEVLDQAGPLGPLPALALRTQVSGIPLQLLAVHPPPPIGATLAQTQQRQQLQWLQWMAERQTPTVLVGDLNATPWGEHFRRLREAGLDDDGWGSWPPSWSPGPPLQWLSLPIDHALAQPPWRVLNRRCGPPLGSDHCPLWAELGVDR